MEEEEEEVLCYLDRVLEEEELFEYGDGELDPITPTHTQFKVRRWLHSWMHRTHTHTRVQYGSRTRCQERETCLKIFKCKVVLVFWRDVLSLCVSTCVLKGHLSCKSVRVCVKRVCDDIGFTAWPFASTSPAAFKERWPLCLFIYFRQKTHVCVFFILWASALQK